MKKQKTKEKTMTPFEELIKRLKIKKGSTIIVENEIYKVIEIYKFHVLTIHKKYGWKESFHFEQLLYATVR